MNVSQMCASYIHENYCMGVCKKDHWCGNRKSREAVKVDYQRQQRGSIGLSEGKNRQ